jgi:hypothetical protein
MTNLLFLISAPRSGSSLLQQILNSHHFIYSVPEPWLMLPLVYLVKEDKEGQNCFNESHSRINLCQFLDSIPNGKKSFQERIKKIAKHTYEDAIPTGTTYTYFLDKTPRYYHIIEELLEWYPDAKFILLARNPVAIFCSIMNYNFKGQTTWLTKNDRLHDILTAPKVLCQFKNNDRVIYINYEQLINQTSSTLESVFQYLNLEPNEEIRQGSYHIESSFRNTSSIDQKSVGLHKNPVTDYLDRWKNTIDTYQKKRLLIDYMNELGENVFEELGYSFESTLKSVQELDVKKEMFSLSLKQISNNFNKGLGLKQQLLIKSLKKIGF